MDRTLQVYMLLTLVLAVGESYALICVCSGTDCHQDVCVGDICFAQIVAVSGEETRRWRCLPRNQHFQCGTSSPYHRIECCDTGDRCNEDLYPNLPESPDGSRSTESIRAAESPSTTTDPTSTTESTPQVAPPSTAPVTAAASYYCYKDSSDTSPQFKLCSSMHGCFFTTRHHQDGRMTYKRGCSSFDRPCEPEDRKRKTKRCCYSNMCNNIAGDEEPVPDIDDDLAPDTDDDLAPDIGPNDPTEGPTNGSNRQDTTEPPTYLPPSNTTRNLSTSTPDPNAPVIDIGNVTEPEPSTDVHPTPDISPSDTSESSIRPPITTDTPFISCYCETCQDRYCTTVVGCATTYTKTDEHRTCITDEICSEEGVVCCSTDLCNLPLTTEEPETPAPTTAVGETPATSDYLTTVPMPTLSAPGTSTTNPILQSTNLSQSSESSISIFYFLTGVVVVIFVVIVVITAIACIGIVVHHRKVMRKIKTKQPARSEERTPTQPARSEERTPTQPARSEERTPTPTNSTTVQEESV